PLAVQLPDELEAVHLGHHQVHQNQGRVGLAHLGQAAAAVDGPAARPAPLPHRPAHQGPVARLAAADQALPPPPAGPAPVQTRRSRSRTAGSSSMIRTVSRPSGASGGSSGGARGGSGAGPVADVASSVGTRRMKVEPWPGALSTAMSPPIIWPSRRLIARPSP